MYVPREAPGAAVEARYPGLVKTRYLLLISLATALVIVGASAVWFLMAVGR